MSRRGGRRARWLMAAGLAALAILAAPRARRLLGGEDPAATAAAAARAAPGDLARRWRAVDLALEAGRLDQALELLELTPEPVDLPGREGDWQRLRARILEAAGRRDEAAAAAWRATELGPKRVETWRDLGVLLYRWFREDLPRGTRGPGLARLLGDARFALATAARFGAGDPVVWLTLGRIHATFGDVRRAREAFERARRLRPPPPGALQARLALLLLDETRPWEEALAAAEVLAAGAGNPGWRVLGGLCLDFFYDGVWQVGAGRRPLAAAARRCFREAVAADPGDAASWYRLGLTAATLGGTEEAAAAFRRAAALAPGSVLARLAEGSLTALQE